MSKTKYIRDELRRMFRPDRQAAFEAAMRRHPAGTERTSV